METREPENGLSCHPDLTQLRSLDLEFSSLCCLLISEREDIFWGKTSHAPPTHLVYT